MSVVLNDFFFLFSFVKLLKCWVTKLKAKKLDTVKTMGAKSFGYSYEVSLKQFQ